MRTAKEIQLEIVKKELKIFLKNKFRTRIEFYIEWNLILFLFFYIPLIYVSFKKGKI